MRFDLIDYFQKLNFIYSYFIKNDFSEEQMYKKILNDKSVVIDVGSNLGNFVNLVKKTNKSCFVHSIEPNKELIINQKNKFKKYNNIKFHNFAINAVNGECEFYIRKPHSHSSLNKEHPDAEFNEIISVENVNTFTIESFLNEEQINEVTLLKLDSEGSDFDILTSCKKILSLRKIKYIKMEATKKNLTSIMKFAEDNNLFVIGINNLFHYKNSLNMLDLYLENKN